MKDTGDGGDDDDVQGFNTRCEVVLFTSSQWIPGGAPLLLEALWHLSITPEIVWSLDKLVMFSRNKPHVI